METESQTQNIKVVIVGDVNVGKTCMVRQYCENVFQREYVPTTVFDHLTHKCMVKGRSILFELRDFSGENEHDQLRPLSYLLSDVIVVCFSLVSVDSLHNVTKKWFPGIKKEAPNIPIILVGTKMDQREKDSRIHVDYKKGLAMAQKIGAVNFVECSALTTNNLESVFEAVVRAVIGQQKRSIGLYHKCINICCSKREITTTEESDLLTLLSSIHTIQPGKTNVLDKQIFEHIDHYDFENWNCFNSEEVRLCFIHGMNKVLSKLLTQCDAGTELSKRWGNLLKYDSNETPLLMEHFNANEQVVMKILRMYTEQISSILSFVVPKTKENILHVFLKRGMKTAVMVLMEHYEVTDLLFTPNIAGDIPLSLAIGQHSIEGENVVFTDVAAAIWDNMLQSRRNSETNTALTEINSKRKNILHTCSDNGMNTLLTKICLESGMDKGIIENALNQPNADGLTPLDGCKDEQTVLKIMDAELKLDTNRTDVRGNNVLHMYAKKNFQICLRKIMESMPNEKRTREILLHKNINGNNPLMSCIFKNSDGSLNYLLGILLTMHPNDENQKLIKKILHEQNTKGDTLLGLILHYQQGTMLSQSIALDLEKSCHTLIENKSQTMKDLTKCLRQHVHPSVEVLNAIKNVEDSYEKSTFQKVLILIKLFWSSFLMPLAIMISDMSFDMILLLGYACYLFMADDRICLTNAIDLCPMMSHLPNSTVCESGFLKNIPNKLNGKPRFFYSLAFITLPWLFYGFEFCHSRHWTNTTRKIQDVMANLGGRDSCIGGVTKYFIAAFHAIVAGLMIVLWPVWMLVKRFESASRAATATSQEKFDTKGTTAEDLVVSARAQIIEVSTEASFQPLLQLYILLPVLLSQFESYSPTEFLRLLSLTDVFESVERVQFWSILTSIVSLSWSFTFYQSIQKQGALDFGSNTAGRILLFFANLLQITSRLLALILYAYLFGPGNFWIMIVSVTIHIFLMSLLHFLTSDEWDMATFKNQHFKIVYHCLINGICNLYLHNWIIQITNTASQKRKPQLKKEGTIFRQIVFDTIFVVENCVIIIVSYFQLQENLPVGLLILIPMSQYIGILLKCVYYYKYHIWKNAFTYEQSIQNIRNSIRSIGYQIRNCKRLERPDSLKINELECEGMPEREPNDAQCIAELGSLGTAPIKVDRHVSLRRHQAEVNGPKESEDEFPCITSPDDSEIQKFNEQLVSLDINQMESPEVIELQKKINFMVM